jgi:RND family efflux transporter MFP subunit
MHRTLIAGLVLSSSLLVGCKDSKMAEEQPKPAPIVLVQKVTFEERDAVQAYAATVKARVVSDQAFRVSGKVVRRLVSVGDVVSVGTPLAEVDTADLKLQLSQALAEVQAAQQSLDQQISQTKRVEKLAKDGWAAQSALDQQHVANDEAQARFDKAKQNQSLAQNAIDYALLKSDSNGVVTDTAIEPGQVVSAGQRAISIARNDDLEAQVAIPESALSRLSDMEASFTIWNDPNKSYVAKLRELSPVADPATRTFAARFTIESPDDALKLGMSGQLHLSAKSQALANVPLAAIFDQGQGPGVWRVDRATGKIELKPVIVASMGQSTASLSSGVTEGEYIVALGAQKLDAGLTIRAVDTLQH